MSRYYVTTPIYYVNGPPHIGHTYTTVVADVIARYRRLMGDETYFLTGTDEHGQNIERTAQEKGLTPQAWADEIVANYGPLWERLAITHDDFIRTTEARHAKGVDAIVAKIAANDDLYVAQHEGWYCASCEAYYTDKELLEGNLCPDHEKPAELRREENLFFRLSKYQDALLCWYEDHPESVRPETRLNEVRSFVAGGLRDLSVSRKDLNWGIPFPGHEEHTVYVWLDALTNYISALGFGRGEDAEALYRQFWEGDGTRLHLVGKDILRFHAVYWPAFLMSAGLPLPTTIWAHGWWLRDDRKLSKSTGNIVDPNDLLETFGSDALRYYLLRDMVFGQDAQISDEGFIDRYNSDLANGLGNTVSRVLTLSQRAFDGQTPPQRGHGHLESEARAAVVAYREGMASFAFDRALKALWKLMGAASQFLVSRAPWSKMKDPAAMDEVGETLWNVMEAVRIVAQGLLPIMPTKAPAVLAAIGAGDVGGDDPMAWGGQPEGAPLPTIAPLFPRIDKAAYLGAAAVAQSKTGNNKTTDKDRKTDMSDATAEDETAVATVATVATDVSETEEATQSAKPSEPGDDARINIDQFFETQLRVASVLDAEKIPKSSKLLRLTVDVGEDKPRTVVAGMAKHYTPEEMIGNQVVIVANLKKVRLMGVESNGMVLAADDGTPVLLRPIEPVEPGTQVR